MGFKKRVADLLWLLSGYKLIGPDLPRKPGIIIGSPHTSNWDFVAFVGVMWNQELNIKAMVKAEWFKGPAAPIIRAFGGLPVDRERPEKLVDEFSRQIESGDSFHLVVAPKGTRSPRPYWKSGFYRIAKQAGVAITLVSIDSNRKEVEVGPTFYPSDSVKADMDLVREFYRDKAGVKPKNRSEPRLRMEEESSSLD